MPHWYATSSLGLRYFRGAPATPAWSIVPHWYAAISEGMLEVRDYGVMLLRPINNPICERNEGMLEFRDYGDMLLLPINSPICERN